jgi:SPOR domain
VKTKKIKAPTPETAKATADENAGAAPVLESRPADQPVNIVGKTGKSKSADETQVAAADPVSEAPAVGGYSVQIASTPSPEAAKSTYAALSRKFGGVLGGRGVNVQKADVAGKGTVYRVRIPAGSKQEAAALCQQYKSAGGNCFITK